MNMTSSPTEEILDDITALDASEFIDARFDNCEFALDVRMFEKHQQQDKVLQLQIKEELKKHPNGTLYTTKEVEGVYLIHKNNKIIPILERRDHAHSKYILRNGMSLFKKVENGR